MTEDLTSRFVGEEYADFIVDYRAYPTIEEAFPGARIFYINETYAIIHFPVASFSTAILRSRLLITPYLYTLASRVSIEASDIQRIRSIPDFNLRGAGVLIGIIDTGINYTLPAFKNQEGRTKIRAIWDQTIQSGETHPFNTYFGTEYTAEQIDEALLAEDPYSVVPSYDDDGHGTMLAGIAAGTENNEVDFAGVAPDSELVIVKLIQAKRYIREFYSVPEGVICYQENSIMWGISYCFSLARELNRPLAICIGIGTSQSAHDGSAPLSQMLSRYADYPQVGVAVAAGNEGNLGRHYYGEIDPAVGSTTLELFVGEEDKGFTMQLWGAGPGTYSVDILSPSGEYIPRIAAGINVKRKITFIFESTVINIEYQIIERASGDQLIQFHFFNTLSGTWRFTVYLGGDLRGSFNIWLPMGNLISRETRFLQPELYTTIITPGTAIIPITVTAYNPVNGALFVNASRGYTRTNIIKPELAAPGVNYIAPALDGSYINYTGTGVAAAHTTGIVALFLEWGVVRGNQPIFDTLEIKKYLIRGARRSATLTYPNRDWGYGIIDVFNTFDVLRQSI